jgi:ATP-dependent DNA helicase RecG
MDADAARQHMERAIDVMRGSVIEPRSDGKVGPKVGAVLLLAGGKTIEACRGEIRDGDHAEYTLLERKCPDLALDGAVLFVTLEPCAPGSRSERKLACAERILLARIKEVWIGIEDPDPTVDREGIRYLQENNVDVHLFDQDLQDAIREVNEDFLQQALERAGTPLEVEPRLAPPSRLDAAVASATMADLRVSALERYEERLRKDSS